MSDNNNSSKHDVDIAVIKTEMQHLTTAVRTMAASLEKLTAIEERLRKLEDHEQRLRKVEAETSRTIAWATGAAAVISFITPIATKLFTS